MILSARMLPVIVMLLVFVATAGAQGLPKAKNPEEVGLSSERLKRIISGLKNDVDKGDFPGAVLMIVRKGKVAYSETIGFRIGRIKFRWPATRSSESPP